MKIYGYWKRGGEKGFFAHTAQIAILGYQGRGIEESADHSGTRGSAFLFLNPGKCNGGVKMGRLNRKGQGTLEYVLILTAIIIAIIAAAAAIRTRVQSSFTAVGDKIAEDVGKVAPPIGETGE